MRGEDLKESYKKNGFVHLKNVIPESEIPELNKLICHAEKKSFVLEIDHFLKHTRIYSLQFNQKILSAIREVFGEEACLLNDINIQVEQFYNDRPDKGWHIDAGAERLAKYLFDENYGYAKIGVYLKSNSAEFGGGVDVEFGGHKSFRYFGRSMLGYVTSLAAYFVDRACFSYFRKKEMIQTLAGDVLIFDSRLPHRSTPRMCNLEAEERKVAIYFQVARDRHNANAYLAHSMRMAVSDENNFRHYFKFLSYNFPKDYPDDYIARCKNSRVNVASLKETIANAYKINFGKGNYKELLFEGSSVTVE